MAKNLNYLQGADALVFIRPLSEAGNKPGALIPYQTGANFEPSRSSKSKETKSGSLPTLASVETDFEVDFIDSTDATSDEIYDSIMNATTLEVWLVQRGRRNAEGKYYAWYMRAMPSKDTSDNDADSQSTRKVKMTVQGTPQRGWTALPDEAQEEINYVFYGLDSTTKEAHGNGTDWNPSTDEGLNVPASNSKDGASSSSAAPSSTASSLDNH